MKLKNVLLFSFLLMIFSINIVQTKAISNNGYVYDTKNIDMNVNPVFSNYYNQTDVYAREGVLNYQLNQKTYSKEKNTIVNIVNATDYDSINEIYRNVKAANLTSSDEGTITFVKNIILSEETKLFYWEFIFEYNSGGQFEVLITNKGLSYFWLLITDDVIYTTFWDFSQNVYGYTDPNEFSRENGILHFYFCYNIFSKVVNFNLKELTPRGYEIEQIFSNPDLYSWIDFTVIELISKYSFILFAEDSNIQLSYYDLFQNGLVCGYTKDRILNFVNINENNSQKADSVNTNTNWNYIYNSSEFLHYIDNEYLQTRIIFDSMQFVNDDSGKTYSEHYNVNFDEDYTIQFSFYSDNPITINITLDNDTSQSILFSNRNIYNQFEFYCDYISGAIDIVYNTPTTVILAKYQTQNFIVVVNSNYYYLWKLSSFTLDDITNVDITFSDGNGLGLYSETFYILSRKVLNSISSQIMDLAEYFTRYVKYSFLNNEYLTFNYSYNYSFYLDLPNLHENYTNYQIDYIRIVYFNLSTVYLMIEKFYSLFDINSSLFTIFNSTVLSNSTINLCFYHNCSNNLIDNMFDFTDVLTQIKVNEVKLAKYDNLQINSTINYKFYIEITPILFSTESIIFLVILMVFMLISVIIFKNNYYIHTFWIIAISWYSVLCMINGQDITFCLLCAIFSDILCIFHIEKAMKEKKDLLKHEE